MTTAKRLAEIQTRADAATDGPWDIENGSSMKDVQKYGHFVYREFWGAVAVCPKESPQFSNHERNMAFIAHARQDVPFLLDLIAERDAEIERLRDMETEFAAMMDIP